MKALKIRALNLAEVAKKSRDLGITTILVQPTQSQIEKQLEIFNFEIKKDEENNAYYLAVYYNNEFLKGCIFYEGEIVEYLFEKDFKELTAQF